MDLCNPLKSFKLFFYYVLLLIKNKTNLFSLSTTSFLSWVTCDLVASRSATVLSTVLFRASSCEHYEEVIIKIRRKLSKGIMLTIPHVYREYIYSVVVYQKYLTRLGELIIFSPLRENYHFSQPS